MFFMFNLVCFLQMVKFALAFRAARVRVDPVAEIAKPAARPSVQSRLTLRQDREDEELQQQTQ